MNKSVPPVQILPPNLTGKDWFVGDIHGHFKKLQSALDQCGFRPSTDRLICVGDLIDKGPESEDAKSWLDQQWVFGVRGNHDDMFLRWRRLKDNKQEQMAFAERTWFPNGGGWILKAAEEDQIELEHAFLRLPYALIVPHPNGRLVAAVHANLPKSQGWPNLLTKKSEEFAKATWSRQRIKKGGLAVDGLDAVICGHTSVSRPTWSGHFFHIDTGGWQKDGLFTIVTLDQVLNDRRNNE